MTMKYDVSEAADWDDEKAAQIIAYVKARPWLQADLDAIYEARGGEPEVEAESANPNVGPDYGAMTVDELQDELRARDLHVSGNKDELIARLQESDA
jgi:SAP domain